MAVPVVWANGRRRAAALADTVERFHALHEELHTYASRDEQPILRGLRLTLVGITSKPKLPPPGARRPILRALALTLVGITSKPKLPTFARSNSKPPLKGRRPAYFRGRF